MVDGLHAIPRLSGLTREPVPEHCSGAVVEPVLSQVLNRWRRELLSFSAEGETPRIGKPVYCCATRQAGSQLLGAGAARKRRFIANSEVGKFCKHRAFPAEVRVQQYLITA